MLRDQITIFICRNDLFTGIIKFGVNLIQDQEMKASTRGGVWAG